MLTDKNGKRDLGSAYYLSRMKKGYISRFIILAIIILISACAVFNDRSVAYIRHGIINVQSCIANAFSCVSDFLLGYRNLLYNTEYERYLQLERDNISLRNEIMKLKQVISENDEMVKLKSAIDKDHKSIIGRVISITSNSYSSSLIINVGKRSGIEKDDFVINEHGLLGRIVDVSDSWSNVVLTTDVNSHIPIKFRSTGNMAIIRGMNNGKMQISMKNGDYDIQPGDDVVTSGYGGLYIEGIHVGKVNPDGFITPGFDVGNLRFVCVVGHIPY